MKTIFVSAVFIVALSLAGAQEYRVREQGLHHRVWERTGEVRDHRGRVNREKSSYTELATGLMYEENGELIASSEEIELFQGGAVARKGQHKVIFPASLNGPDGIDYESVDKKRFRSQILGLSYFEVPTGRSVLIAEIKDCDGVVHAPNRVVYSDALTDITAEVRYTYTRGGFAQDVILLENPPAPEDYGLDPALCRLEILTEFSEAVDPTRKVRRKLPSTRAGQPEGIDEELQFGQMRIGTGKAFLEQKPGSARVGKLWTVIDGRQFLVESVDYLSTKPLLDALPVAGVAAVQKARAQRVAVRNGRGVPGKRQAQVKSKPIQMATAEVDLSGPRLVLDYEILNGTTNDFTFQADRTYYISGPVTLNGTTTVEGGTVIKYAPTNTAKLTLGDTPIFKTGPFQMAYLTARDDDTIGEAIAGSSGSPSGYYANRAFAGGTTEAYQYLRICYADTGIYLGDDVATVKHCQFVRCRTAIQGDNGHNEVGLGNVLFNDVQVAFDGVDLHAYGSHVTLNICSNLTAGGSGTCTLKLTNSLLVAVTNNGPFTVTTSYVFTANSPSGTFESVGGGAHYLASGSSYRDAGTTNIDATLLSELRGKTTYPPLVVFSNAISIHTNFSINAARDTDVPDIGYHYDPIDYAMGSVIVTNATLTLTNGVAIATFGDPGIALNDNAQIISQGTPERRNQICRYNTVQEQSTNWGNGSVASHSQLFGFQFGVTAPIATFRFTDFSSYANGGYHVYTADSLWLFNPLVVRDCNFNVGKIIVAGSEASRIGLTNNLFHRVDADFTYYAGLNAYNNLFKSGECLFEKYNSTNDWVFKDNSFDGTVISDDSLEAFTHDHNAYINCATRLTPNGANDVVTNSFTYQVGPLGRFYQPTNSALVNKGSTNANLIGLYYHTTATNQTVEGNSTVDIGLHYIAVDASGAPLDSDYDGIPDYIADPSGNGIVEPTEVGNLKLWLRADAGVTTNGAGSISAWADQSGSGCNAVQNTSANQALLATNTLNTLPVVRFDGTDDYFLFQSGPLTNTSQGEMFVVLKAAVDAPGGIAYLGRFGSASSSYPAAGGAITETFGSSSSYSLGDPNASLDQFRIYNVSAGPAPVKEWSARLDGVLLKAVTNNTYNAHNVPTLGATPSSFDGDIAEVLIYSRALTQEERNALGNYLGGKYALVTAPAAPSNLVARAISSNQISVAWSVTLTNSASRFKVERKQGAGGAYAVVAVVEGGMSYLEGGLTTGEEYFYRVKAVNYGGESDYSNEASATPVADQVEMPVSELVLWLKADAGHGGGYLTLWADQSGRGNHAYQAPTANRPMAVGNSANGRPVVRFDGTDDYFLFQSSPLTNTSQAEIFVVLKAAVDSPGSVAYLGRFGSTSSSYPAAGGALVETFGSSSSYNLGNPVPPLDQHHIYNVSAGLMGNWSVRLDGIVLKSVPNNVYNVHSVPTLGAVPSSFDGDIAEVLIYSRALTDEERDAVGRYLAHKYAVVDGPVIPAGLLATGVSGSALNLTWTNSSVIAGVSYHVERKAGAGGTYSKVGTVRNSTSLLDSNAPAATNYYYRIKAENYNTNSAYSVAMAPPFLAITNAQWGDVLISDTNRYLIADVQDSDGTVTQVVYYGASGSIAETLTNSPFNLQLSKLLSGHNTTTVRAWDNAGNTRITPGLTFTLSYDTDGDGAPDFSEIVNGTNPYLADTDGDGTADNADAFPLDPGRSSIPNPDPGDTTPPTIIIDEPAEATPVP